MRLRHRSDREADGSFIVLSNLIWKSGGETGFFGKTGFLASKYCEDTIQPTNWKYPG
jgi:hypothetical protein